MKDKTNKGHRRRLVTLEVVGNRCGKLKQLRRKAKIVYLLM